MVPVKEGDSRSYGLQKKAIENIIKHPNGVDSYRQCWGKVIDDLLIGDNGSAELVFTGALNKPMDIYPVNGFALEQVRGFFTDPTYPRFVQIQEGAKRIYFKDKDILYFQHHLRTDSPYGLSPIESAFKELRALFDAQEYAGRQSSNAIPKNALNLGEGVNEQDLIAFRKYFREEVYGSGETAIVGGTKGAGAMKIGANGDSELFLEWQKHLITITALAFGIDPKKLGQGSNTDRSTVEEQNATTLAEAIRPRALIVQDVINEKIIGRLGLDDVLKFEFVFEDTLEQKKQKQGLIVEQWTSGGLTYKEYRTAMGWLPVDSPYNDMTQAEMKCALNKKYAVQTGGFNGVGKDQKDGIKKNGKAVQTQSPKPISK